MKNLFTASKTSIALHLSDSREVYLLASGIACLFVSVLGFAKGFIGSL